MSFSGFEDVIGFFADEELAGTDEDKIIAVGLDFATIRSSFFCSCTLFAILLVQPACKAGILTAARRAEMADVEQMKKIVPFVTCESTFGENVGKLMFGINVSSLNFRIKINSVKQPIQSFVSSSVSPGTLYIRQVAFRSIK